MTAPAVAILPDDEVGPWRPLTHWAIGLPHLLLTGVLTVLGAVAAVAAALAVVVTGRVPARLAEFEVYVVRERVRTFSHFFLLRRSYPPFPHRISAFEPGDDPHTHVEAVGPIAVPRWSPLARLAVAVPHLLVLAPVGLVLDLLYPAWMIAVSAQGGWPAGMRNFLVRVEEWTAELLLYVGFATDRAPHFGFAPAPSKAPAGIVSGRAAVVGSVTRSLDRAVVSR